MRTKIGWVSGLVAGFVAGIALVLACGGPGDGAGGGLFDAGTDAEAQSGSCRRWDIIRVFVGPDTEGVEVIGEEIDEESVYRLPQGWEPFAVFQSNGYNLRRCAD